MSRKTYALVIDNIVTQIQYTPRTGFVEVPNYVVPEYLYDPEIDTYYAPEPQINEMEDFILSERFSWTVKKYLSGNRSMTNGSFFDSNSGISTGSWSGFSNECSPLIIPYNCKIENVIIAFSEANFDWNSSPNNINLVFDFHSHQYNNAPVKCRLKTTINDTFSGNTTGTNNHKYIISDIEELINHNQFIQGEIIGVRFTKSGSGSGDINSIRTPLVNFLFTRI